MACITFVTLGATKAEKLSALQSDQEGLYIFFKKSKDDQKLFDHAGITDNFTSLVASYLKRIIA